MKRNCNCVVRCLAVAVGLEVVAGTVSVDFSTTVGNASDGARAPSGWVYSGIGKADNTAYFNAISDYMASPLYADVITNVAVSCRCSNAAATRLLRIVPLSVTADGVATNESAAVVLEPRTTKTTQAVAFDAALNVRALRIGMAGSGTAGNWNLYSLVVSHTGPDSLTAPTGLRNANVTEHSFTAAWERPPGAASCALRVWSESRGDPTYEVVSFVENFDQVANSGKNPSVITGAIETCIGPEWEGALVYAPGKSQGIVQIGNSDSRGWLLSPPLTEQALSGGMLVLQGKRCPSRNNGSSMPVDVVHADATTNAVVVLELTDDWDYHAVPLSGLSPGDRILFHSITNGSERRAWIDSVRIVSGYVPGVVSTNEVFFEEGLTQTEWEVANLQSGDYLWSVRADAAGEEGLWSETAVVALGENGGTVEPPPPSGGQTPGLRATFVASNAFTVVWDAVVGADGYLVTVTTNGVTPAQEGNVLWRETFHFLNRDSSSKVLPVETLNALSDWKQWTGTNLYTCTLSDGCVQIGNTANRGILHTGALGLSGTGMVLKFVAERPKDDGRILPLALLRGAETNWSTHVSLTTEPSTYVVELPALTTVDSLAFHSTTNTKQGRVYMGGMSIVSDYVPAHTSAVAVVENRSVADCTFSLDNLSSTHVTVALSAVVGGATGAVETLEIDLTNPTMEGVLRASLFDAGRYEANLSCLTNITKATPWENGVTIPGFFAYQDGVPEGTIRYDSGKATVAGLYASAGTRTNGVLDVSLSILGSGDHAGEVEMRILNDHPHRVAIGEVQVDFTAYQWHFPVVGGTSHALTAEWAVTTGGAERPPEANWREGARFVAEATAEEGENYRAVDLSFQTGRIHVPADGICWVRWRIGRGTNAPMLGVGNVEVQVLFLPEPTALVIR